MRDKINFKLVNVLLLVAIVCLLYTIRGLLTGIIAKAFDIVAPFMLAFAIAYAIYPVVKKLIESGAPKWLAILVVTIISLGIILILVILVVPLLYEQILLFLSNISVFLSDLSNRYAINLGSWQTSVSEISGDVIKNLGSNISNGAVTIVNTSINFITKFAVIVCVTIYFLVDMDKIRVGARKYFLNRSRRTYQYFKKLDIEMAKYVIGILKNILVQMIEYTFAFAIIGHPNYLILGILSGLSAIIPWFGGLIVIVLSLLVSSVLSTKLFILTVIICIICPVLDGNVIGPKIYGHSNKLHPLLIIFAVSAGGIIAGFWGIVVSIPVAIFIKVTYNFYKRDIDKRIIKMKKRIS